MTTLFSFIIPCYNEEKNIERCLKSILNQNLPKSHFDIIVVDNGSTDNSLKISKKYADKVLSAPGKNVGEVRNIGVENTDAETIIFIDGDCAIDENWLNRAMLLISNSDQTIYGGGALLPPSPTWIEKYWLLEGRYGNALPKDLIGCSIIIRKDIFQGNHGFNPHMISGEDSEFSHRLTKNGFQISITRDLNVVHYGNAKTIWEFIKRQSWHGQAYKNKGIENLKDPVFILTALFILFIFNGVAFSNFWSLFFALTIFPAILSMKRILRYKPKHLNFHFIFIRIYIIDLIYLAGRSAGVLMSLLK